MDNTKQWYQLVRYTGLMIFLLPIMVFAQTSRSYIQYWSTKYTRNTEGDLVVLSNGNIISYFSRFYGGASDFAGSDIYSKISKDGGLSWYNYTTAQPNLAINTMDASALYDGTTISLFFLVRVSDTDLRPYMKTSTTNGATWTAPVKLFTSAGYWVVNNNRIVKIASGRLICPTSRVANVADYIAGTEQFTASCWYSDDGGSTWSESNRISGGAAGQGLQEAGVVELSAGNLLMYMRSLGGKQYFANSSDNGATWGAAYQSTLNSPNAPAKIIKLSDGRLCAAHCDNAASQVRKPLALSVSSDNGATWTRRMVIGNNTISTFTYPSLQQVGDTLYISHWEQISSKNVFSQVFQKIPTSSL